ncbi:SHOCT domain-containing protein [Leucobacter tenebrionis]|uniref:SHOCT domain-containing protein n=1 Tax=Leucobacter tenebrionis TaxID=2873270 RepID=UPI001CA6C3B2|nr:SHOCT domain-containing protein [Leucobacter tenebrionis]QZY51513.1 SHOCT domain-containing protein [Leucobacter tenebrionis]
MSFWSNIWDAIWWMLTIFVFIAYLMALFSIISDLFRDRKLNGFAKAIWLIFLVFLPFLTALVYLIARGRGMGERAQAQADQAQQATESYIRSVAAETTPTDEIARAKQLLDAGAISEDEYASLKAAALARVR